MPRRPADPQARQRWRNFLRKHREVLAAMDFVTVPTAGWIVQQLREAFAYDAAPRYLVFDNDKKYVTDVLAVIVLNERHLHRLIFEFVAYYHDDRTHLALGKSTPSMRTTTSKPNRHAAIVGHPRVGGLHHRYEWRQAA